LAKSSASHDRDMMTVHSTCFKEGTGESAAKRNHGIISDPTETRETLARGSTRTVWRTASSYESRRVI
jgi:hypothetical protein